MSAPSTRMGSDVREEQPMLLAMMKVQHLSLQGDSGTSGEKAASLVMMEVWGCSLAGDRETSEEEPASLALM